MGLERERRDVQEGAAGWSAPGASPSATSFRAGGRQASFPGKVCCSCEVEEGWN